MHFALKLLFAFVIVASSASAQSAQASSPEGVPEPLRITFCDLARDPGVYNHELVQVTAFVTHGFEDFQLNEPDCPVRPHHFSVWVMYGGNAESDTVYCCPGEGQGTRSKSLTVEGIQVPLFEDQAFQDFTSLLKKEPDTTVRVTVVGRFFSGEKQTYGSSTSWGDFGHLGCCSLFVIQRIERFEPHTRNDLDYSAEAGWYEKEGCKIHSVGSLRDASISYEDEYGKEAKAQAIAEQRMADNGDRSWAFTDPQRVALESLKPFYAGRIPVLRNVKKTPTRQVFRLRDGKKSIVVVVTKPYWLSFYSASGSVPWVSTMIKEAVCR